MELQFKSLIRIALDVFDGVLRYESSPYEKRDASDLLGVSTVSQDCAQLSEELKCFARALTGASVVRCELVGRLDDFVPNGEGVGFVSWLVRYRGDDPNRREFVVFLARDLLRVNFPNLSGNVHFFRDSAVQRAVARIFLHEIAHALYHEALAFPTGPEVEGELANRQGIGFDVGAESELEAWVFSLVVTGLALGEYSYRRRKDPGGDGADDAWRFS